MLQGTQKKTKGQTKWANKSEQQQISWKPKPPNVNRINIQPS